MKVTVKYVTRRLNNDGVERWYWQRKGHPLVRLPDDPLARFATAMRLNAEAEGRVDRQVGPVPGTLDHVINDYQDGDGWAALAQRTRWSYGTWLKRYSAKWGDLDVRAITRPAIVDFLKTVSRGSRRLAAAVLQVALDHARYLGLVDTNQAERLRIRGSDGRAEYLDEATSAAWLAAAQGHPDGARMTMAFALMLYTAQRPRDCLAMAWTRYDGQAIQLRQMKTHKLLSVPCHRDLRAMLEASPRQHVAICAGLAYNRFNAQWREICRQAGIVGKQARDLRRSAIVRLHEAGCEPLEISHISGHSLADVNSVLDRTYTVRTAPTAQRAMKKWENTGGTESNGS